MKLSEQLKTIRDYMKIAPVDVFAMARSLGLGCHAVQLTLGISGMLEYVSEDEYRLSYNESDPETRQRFTVAHEIGHFILHKKLIGTGVDDDTAYRSTGIGKYHNTAIGLPQEREANVFAASMLMPRHLVAKYLEKSPDADSKDLARHLNVSEQAMSIRLDAWARLRDIPKARQQSGNPKPDSPD